MESRYVNEDGIEVVYKESFWSGKKEIYIGGEKLYNIDKKTYQYNNEVYKIKGSYLFGATLVGNGKTIELVRKLTILEIILTILPIALVFIGGAIGGACGGASAVLVATFIRKQESVILKILVFLAILGLAVAAWLFLSSLYLMAFGN